MRDGSHPPVRPIASRKYRALTELVGETEGDDVGPLLGLVDGEDEPVIPIGEIYMF